MDVAFEESFEPGLARPLLPVPVQLVREPLKDQELECPRFSQSRRGNCHRATIHPVRFRPQAALEECGYTGARLEPDFKFGLMTIPLVGFATKPWDFDSACIAVVDSGGQPETAARSCRDLGAPVVWVRHNGHVDWWVQHDSAPTLFASKPVGEFATLVRQHKETLGPLSIYRGKTIARVVKSRQLDFVDAGLLPLLREEAGKKTPRLGRSNDQSDIDGTRPGKPQPRCAPRCVYRCVSHARRENPQRQRRSWIQRTSALSHDDLRVDRLQFKPRIVNLELPVDAALLGVALFLPGGRFRS